MPPLRWIPRFPRSAICRIPSQLASVTTIGEDEEAAAAGVARGGAERVWDAVRDLYRSGVHPALQLCILRRGRVVLHRALGHAAGNAPRDPPDAERIPVTLDTPFGVFSASKAVTAMVIHKLDEQGVLHLDDRVCDYVPEFGRHGKHRITLRHVLCHRAGIPGLPPEAIDLDLLARPGAALEVLCAARPRTRPGRLLAYHAISGGFVLGEVVRRAAGRDIREVLAREILEPLGLRWMRYGVAPEDVDKVAVNALTGPPLGPPFSQLFERALGANLARVVELSNDPRFLVSIVPSANVVTTAREFAAFYQCLLDQGELDGVRVFDRRTIGRATSEQSIWELDFTLGLPLRYSLGFMLGGRRFSPFGPDTPEAFGHLGLSNVFGWADPERELVVVLLTSGKPMLGLYSRHLVEFLRRVSRVFPKLPAGEIASRRRRTFAPARVA